MIAYLHTFLKEDLGSLSEDVLVRTLYGKKYGIISEYGYEYA